MKIKIREDEISIITSDEKCFYLERAQFKEVYKAFNILNDLFKYEPDVSLDIEDDGARKIYQL